MDTTIWLVQAVTKILFIRVIPIQDFIVHKILAHMILHFYSHLIKLIKSLWMILRKRASQNILFHNHRIHKPFYTLTRTFHNLMKLTRQQLLMSSDKLKNKKGLIQACKKSKKFVKYSRKI